MDRSQLSVRVALVVTIVAWASSFSAMRIALTGFTPAHVALLRYAVCAAALLAIARRAGVRLPRGGDLARVGAIGALGLGVYNVVLAAGQRGLPAGTASLLIATAPIWMAAIAAAIGRERIGGRAATGLVAGFAGVALIQVGRGALGGDAGPIALALAAAAIQAVYSLSQRSLVARYGALSFLTCAAGAAALALLPAAGGVVDALRAAPAAAIAAVVFLGLVPGALGYGAWAYASTRVSTAAAGATLYAVPPAAMLIAFASLGEVPTPAGLAGGALIIAAVALTRARPRREVAFREVRRWSPSTSPTATASSPPS
jgi:drug/metabolite transporter (DMT)-like permease